MAYNARVDYVATGGTDFAFPFSYLDPAFVKVAVDGDEVSATLPSAGTVRILPAPPIGAAVTIFRQSGAPGQTLVNFQNNRALSGDALNTSYRHALARSEEAVDTAEAVVATAVEAARDAAAAISRSVPGSTPSDAGKVLKAGATADSYSWQPNTFPTPTSADEATPKGYVDAQIAALQAAVAALGPKPGDRKVVYHNVLEPGWGWSNGAAVSRTTYSALFAKIGTTYGAGDGVTTFNLPDECGRATFGRDNMGGIGAKGRLTAGVSGVDGTTLGAAGGDQRAPQHTHGVNDPPHTHGVNDPGHAHTVLSRHTVTGGAAGGVGFWEGDSTAGTGLSGTGIYLASAATGVTIQSSGAGTAQNVPPALVVNVMIFLGGADEPDPGTTFLSLETGQPLLTETGAPIEI